MPADAAPVPAAVGRYLIFDEIGVGGMASVHLGMLTGAVGFRRIVALKQLHSRFIHDPDFVAQFINEARLAARIHHTNVVQTLDVVWTGTQLLLVLEYVDGDTLNRVLRSAVERELQIPVEVACSMVAGLLHGLHAAHEVRDEEGVPLDIVHRDVSPQNILIARDGVARVLDFGVAKALAQSPNTQSGLLKGKFGYMAPEQILRGHVDRRTDVFAAGVVLWETLTCRRLFQASKNMEQALARVVTGEIPTPSSIRPEIPPQLDAIAMQAMARDPERRFQTAEELAVALEGTVNLASPHFVKTWFAPLMSPELVQRAELIRRISKRYGTPGRSTPHPDELADEARAALAAAAAHEESLRGSVAGSEPPTSPRSRSGRFPVNPAIERPRAQSGIRLPRLFAFRSEPEPEPEPEERVAPTTRTRLSPQMAAAAAAAANDPAATPSAGAASGTSAARHLSARHVGGAMLALVLIAAAWVTAAGQTRVPPMDPSLTGAALELPSFAPDAVAVGGADGSGELQTEHLGLRPGARGQPTTPGNGASRTAPEHEAPGRGAASEPKRSPPRSPRSRPSP